MFSLPGAAIGGLGGAVLCVATVEEVRDTVKSNVVDALEWAVALVGETGWTTL
jgi:hypothetical protein